MRFGCVLAVLMTLAAQDPKPPAVVSPEVLPDGRVMVRLWAPKAAEVTLSGDWMGPTPPVALVRNDEGVWTATVGPLDPHVYTYGFIVDGVRAADPVCRCTLTWARRGASSRFVVPGPTPQPWEERPTVAKGTLHHESYFSRHQQRVRRFVVYTPPRYTNETRMYPALLLLSGTPGDETDWTTGGGFADTIFDNLIADGTMQPMVVVMHAGDVLMNGKRAGNVQEFEAIAVDELVPEIRRRYRVERNAASWALVGLSLGGEVALAVGLRHPELFRTVGAISGSLVERDFDDRFGKALAQPAAIAKQYRLIWFGSGTSDIFHGGNKVFSAKLTAAAIPHEFHELAGHHVMPVFRRELIALLPKLFVSRPTTSRPRTN